MILRVRGTCLKQEGFRPHGPLLGLSLRSHRPSSTSRVAGSIDPSIHFPPLKVSSQRSFLPTIQRRPVSDSPLPSPPLPSHVYTVCTSMSLSRGIGNAAWGWRVEGITKGLLMRENIGCKSKLWQPHFLNRPNIRVCRDCVRFSFFVFSPQFDPIFVVLLFSLYFSCYCFTVVGGRPDRVGLS